MNDIQNKIDKAYSDFKEQIQVICGKKTSVRVTIHNVPAEAFTEKAKTQSACLHEYVGKPITENEITEVSIFRAIETMEEAK
jgi:hypothetical protein